MSATDAAREWNEKPQADREAYLHQVLSKQGVARWVESYQGENDPEVIAEALEAEGLCLDDVDAGVIAVAIDDRRVMEGATVSEIFSILRRNPTRWVEAN